MDTNASDIPIGQTVVVTDTTYIKGTLKRISETECLFEQFNPANGALVLRTKLNVHSGASEFEYVDQNFWTVTVDGRPIGSGEIAHGKVQTNAQARTLNVTTK